MLRLFTDVRMEQKDIQEEEKKTNEQETTDSLYHGEMRAIKDDLLAQSKNNIFSPHNLLNIYNIYIYTCFECMNLCVSARERERARCNGTVEIPEYALSLTQLREFAKLIYYSIKTRDPTAQG